MVLTEVKFKLTEGAYILRYIRWKRTDWWKLVWKNIGNRVRKYYFTHQRREEGKLN